MFKDRCISVTDLRTKTKECLKNLAKEPKYIFMNNQPIAVLVDVNDYDAQFLKPKLLELDEEQMSAALKKRAQTARRSTKSQLTDI